MIPKDSLAENEASEMECNKFIYNDRGELIQIEGFAYGLNFEDTYEEVNKIIFEHKKEGVIKKFYNDKNKKLSRSLSSER